MRFGGKLGWTAFSAAFAVFAAQAKDVSAYRAFVADRASGTVHVLDLDARKALDPLTLPATSRLTAGSSARVVYAASPDAGAVFAIDTGISLLSHGDHMDIQVSPPKLLPTKVAGEKPSHVVAVQGRVAMFFDGDGTARLLDEGDILKGEAAERVFGEGPAHHGVAVARRDWVAVSTPQKVGENWSAYRVALYGLDGAARAVSPDCPGLHGEAASSRMTVFGCKDGVLTLSPGGAFAKVAYPEGTGETVRIYTVDPAPGFSMFVGDFGPNALIGFSPDEAAFHRIPLPEARVAFAVDPSDGGRVFVVLADGSVRIFNTITGAELARRDGVVTAAADLPEGVRERSRLAVAGPHILVTDPARGRAVQLSGGDLSVTATYDLGGKPMFAAAVGAEGVAH